MVGRVETDRNGRAAGERYHREGRWRFHVVVAGYAIETLRLLLNAAIDRFPGRPAPGTAGARTVDTCHPNGTARIGDDPTASVDLR
ncbi:hypothetical protein [Bradyrhizobium sp. WD16]|uniref:hypothetical protein n=1 Tax=Bradyrhizobium sp. WD16 TaxID=1521768 RepID=UPI003531DBEB